ncbi:MAG: hypothetical protein LBB40_04195, partial [Holophagales bacterium]|nr:hypothetical protein [Holophagales bacterium]
MLFDRRTRLILSVSALTLFAVIGASWFFVSHSVRAVMAVDGRAIKPLGFVALPLPPQGTKAEWLGGGEVRSVAVSADSLWTAGSFGVINDDGVQPGLPSLKVSAMLLWRGNPLVALEAGG